jgi:hypothetical protein
VLERSFFAPKFVAQFSEILKERSETGPSQNVSVRKKIADCFQWLTEILIEPLFRSEILNRRTEGEQQETADPSLRSG